MSDTDHYEAAKLTAAAAMRRPQQADRVPRPRRGGHPFTATDAPVRLGNGRRGAQLALALVAAYCCCAGLARCNQTAIDVSSNEIERQRGEPTPPARFVGPTRGDLSANRPAPPRRSARRCHTLEISARLQSRQAALDLRAQTQRELGDPGGVPHQVSRGALVVQSFLEHRRRRFTSLPAGQRSDETLRTAIAGAVVAIMLRASQIAIMFAARSAAAGSLTRRCAN